MSYFNNILDAVTSVVASTLPGYSVTRRKDPVLWDQDSLPKAIISSRGPGRPIGLAFENNVEMAYDVSVVLYRAGNQVIQGAASPLPDDAQAVRQALHTASLTGVTAVWDVPTAELSDMEDASGVTSNYDTAFLSFRFYTVEARSA